MQKCKEGKQRKSTNFSHFTLAARCKLNENFGQTYGKIRTHNRGEEGSVRFE